MGWRGVAWRGKKVGGLVLAVVVGGDGVLVVVLGLVEWVGEWVGGLIGVGVGRRVSLGDKVFWPRLAPRVKNGVCLCWCCVVDCGGGDCCGGL